MDQETEVRNLFNDQALRAVREAYAISAEVRSSPTLRRLSAMCHDEMVDLLKQLCDINLRAEGGLDAALRVQDELVQRRAILDMLALVTAEADQAIAVDEGERDEEYAEDQLPPEYTAEAV